jgi:hypothetical protein
MKIKIPQIMEESDKQPLLQGDEKKEGPQTFAQKIKNIANPAVLIIHYNTLIYYLP